MIVPNTHRVIIKPIKLKKVGGILLQGDVSVGENLLYGEIIHPGDTRFKKTQKVYYSGYSASAIVDAEKLELGSGASKEGLVIVAQDDIMAYQE